MKPAGKLSEFTQFPRSGQSGQGPVYYVYRLSSVRENSARPEITGLLLQALSPNDHLPFCLAYRAAAGIDELINQLVENEPDFIFRSEENTKLHQFWLIKDAGIKTMLENRLDQIARFYQLESWVYPDAGSVTGNDSGNELSSRIDGMTSALLLADNQLEPQPCHRLFAGLNGMDDYEFLQRLQKCFNIRVASGAVDASPQLEREFGLYVAGYWYHLRLIEGTWFHADPVSDLDVSVVHDNMIAPMLGIVDRRDSGLSYTSADCNSQSLQELVDSGQWQAAWLMPALTVGQLMNISDLGRKVPPNSVCFTPLVDAAVFASIAR